MAEHTWWVQLASFEEWLAGTAERWKKQLFVFDEFYSWTGSTQLNGIYITCASVIVQHNFSTPADDFHAFTLLVLSLYIFYMIHLSYKTWSFSISKMKWLSPDFWPGVTSCAMMLT